MKQAFHLIIIGDEVIHGDRRDKHFPFFKKLLQQHGLQLASVLYLPDERQVLVEQLQRSFSQNLPTFITGGIGGTPDDHTRQAAAMALNLPLVRHPQAAELIRQASVQRGDAPDSPIAQQRLQMADFVQGADLIPNPYNKIAGFSIEAHYFLPGFPVMAHPMAQWVLQTYYTDWFDKVPRVQQSLRIYGLSEAAITPMMLDLQARFVGVKAYSLPSIRQRPQYIEFGVKAEGAACQLLPQAWAWVKDQLVRLGGVLG